MNVTFFRSINTALLLLLFIIPGSAQTGFPVTGKVSGANGEALPGVTIQVKGANNKTVSKADGTFQINVPSANSTLSVSSVGYAAQQIPVNGQNQITIGLAQQASSLEGVVV